MAIIGAVIGVGAVVGFIGSDDYDNYSDYGDYDNYSNYSDYDDYSDAAERTNIRLLEKKREIENKKYEINIYKSDTVNDYLQSDVLIQQSGVKVSVTKVKDDGNLKLDNEENNRIEEKSSYLQAEIRAIDQVLDKIDKILAENDHTK